MSLLVVRTILRTGRLPDRFLPLTQRDPFAPSLFAKLIQFARGLIFTDPQAAAQRFRVSLAGRDVERCGDSAGTLPVRRDTSPVRANCPETTKFFRFGATSRSRMPRSSRIWTHSIWITARLPSLQLRGPQRHRPRSAYSRLEELAHRPDRFLIHRVGLRELRGDRGRRHAAAECAIISARQARHGWNDERPGPQPVTGKSRRPQRNSCGRPPVDRGGDSEAKHGPSRMALPGRRRPIRPTRRSTAYGVPDRGPAKRRVVSRHFTNCVICRGVAPFADATGSLRSCSTLRAKRLADRPNHGNRCTVIHSQSGPSAVKSRSTRLGAGRRSAHERENPGGRRRSPGGSCLFSRLSRVSSARCSLARPSTRRAFIRSACWTQLRPRGESCNNARLCNALLATSGSRLVRCENSLHSGPVFATPFCTIPPHRENAHALGGRAAVPGASLNDLARGRAAPSKAPECRDLIGIRTVRSRSSLALRMTQEKHSTWGRTGPPWTAQPGGKVCQR